MRSLRRLSGDPVSTVPHPLRQVRTSPTVLCTPPYLCPCPEAWTAAPRPRAAQALPETRAGPPAAAAALWWWPLPDDPTTVPGRPLKSVRPPALAVRRRKRIPRILIAPFERQEGSGDR